MVKRIFGVCALVVMCSWIFTQCFGHVSDAKAGWITAAISVWPHVLDRWCAGLMVVVVILSFFASRSKVLDVVSFAGDAFHNRQCHDVEGLTFQGPRPKLQVGVGHLSRWWWVLVSVLLLHRGEALNPGPVSRDETRGKRSWSMGTFNPSGLGGKHQVVSSYLAHGHLWAVTETHLTSQGLQSFRRSLKWSNSEFVSCIGGHPVPLRSHSCATGSWNGVAVLSKFPTRAVPIPWNEHTFETSRVQITTTLCENMWVTGGVIYGEPPGVHHPDAKANTDTLALEVVSHLANLSGLRYFAGDLNFEHGGLEVFKVLSDAGFQDIQDLAFSRWGQPIVNTCKQSTRKDFFFISRELIPFLTGVRVDDTVWADHAVLQGFFQCGPQQLTKHYWRQPATVEWPQSFDVSFSSKFRCEQDPTRKYEQMWKEIESAGSSAKLSHGQQPFKKKQCGRGSTMDTKLVTTSFHQSPVKQGRVSDVQPLFAGISQQHAHWFRQLRRLQSFARFRKTNSTDTPHGHGVSLWSSILRAKGFDSNFSHWWVGNASQVFGAPKTLPLCPPPFEVATKIYESFLIDVRKLEQHLKSQRLKFARDKRQELAHLIFRDIRRTAPDKVDVLLKTQSGEVLEVDTIENSFTVSAGCSLCSEHPIFVAGAQVSVLRVQGNRVWILDAQNVTSGQAVRQSTFTGEAADMFRLFGEEWSKRWDRHKGIPPSQWEQICNFGRRCFHFDPITLQEWSVDIFRNELARKKPQSATGLDGVSLADLKAMPSSVLEAHCDIYRLAEGQGIWPKQTLVGKVASLAKSDAPSTVSGYRPITVLPHSYRIWSGVRAKALLSAMNERCPAFLFGNKPHCQASQVWTHLAWSIENAFIGGTAIAGIVADIEKAYNHLPREVVFQTSILFGLPFSVLRAWAAAMGGLERRFQIREHLGPPVPSATGYPEGCALSCLAMMLLDCVFHRWFEMQFPLCQPVSYVDDLQLMTTNPVDIPDMLTELHTFSALVDLTVDAKKTFVWCNAAYHRARFRKLGLPVRKHARGLGAQLQFGRQHSTAIIQQRIQAVKALWPRLCQSLSPYKVKVLAIKQAAWSQCLHGIAATSISQEVFGTLRTQAMVGLNATGAGCNPCVHLGLVEHPLLDPYCWSIVSTLRTIRECATRENLSVLLQEAVEGSPSLPSTGMTMILLTRLHQLGWEITSGINCHDGLGEFSLLDISFPELLLRVTWSWQKWVAATVAHRPTFEGLASCDPVSTREFLKALSVSDQGLMRKALNGALFTNDSLCYFSSTGSTVCQFCGEVDSKLHRFWQCQVFSADRQIEDPGFWEVFPKLPNSLVCHGWALRSPTWEMWQRQLLQIQHPVVSHSNSPLGAEWLDLFTDGSCLWPRDRDMRLASWSIVEASPDGDVHRSQVVWAGPLAGILQSAYRAELRAVCCALQYAVFWKKKVRVWSDCLSVVQKFKQLVFYNRRLKPNEPHFDLWSEVLESVEKLGSEAIKITKVAAHQDVTNITNALECWAFQRNMIADRTARLANLQREADFWLFHRRHCLATQWARQTSSVVQRVILSISRKVVARETVQQCDETGTSPEAAHEQPLMSAPAPQWNGFVPGAPLPQELSLRFGHRFVAKLVAWWAKAQQEFEAGCATSWISVHQLYLDFQHQTGELGLVNQKGWKDPEILPGLKLVPKTFKRRSSWFGRVLKATFKAYGCDIPWMVTRPSSDLIALHTSCVAVPWPQWRLTAVEQWLSTRLPAKKAATRNGDALVHLPPAKQDVRWPPLQCFEGPICS